MNASFVNNTPINMLPNLDVEIMFRNISELMQNAEFCGEGNPIDADILLCKAMSILKSLEEILTRNLDNTSDENVRETKICKLAIAHLYLSKAYSLSNAEIAYELLLKCVNLLKNKEAKPKAIWIAMNAFHELGSMCYNKNDLEKAIGFLLKVEQIYNEFINTYDPHIPLIFITKTFEVKDNETKLSARKLLDTKYINTLNYLVSIYDSLNNYKLSAKYCQLLFCTQLNDMHNLNYIEWTSYVTEFSHYFIDRYNFTNARHLLAAATYVLEKYEDILKKETEEDSDSVEDKWENCKRIRAEQARSWAEYGLMLLSLSMRRLKKENELEEEDDQSDDNSSESEIDCIKFDTIKNKIKPIENQITDKYLLNFNDAKLVFVNVQKWLHQAKLYYTLEEHASIYIEIAQDMSQAYNCLSCFENDEDRITKMHKRRIYILEDVIQKILPVHYLYAYRKISCELGLTYFEMYNIKVKREKFTPQTLIKINKLARNSIKHLETFLNSYNFSTEMKQFPDEIEQIAIYCYLLISKLYSKLPSDNGDDLENTRKKHNAYKFVMDYCKKYPDALGKIFDDASCITKILYMCSSKTTTSKEEKINKFFQTFPLQPE